MPMVDRWAVINLGVVLMHLCQAMSGGLQTISALPLSMRESRCVMQTSTDAMR